MERYRGQICVTVEELTDRSGSGAIMSYSNYQKLAFRGRINVLREGKGMENYALIEFGSLPERFQTAYVAKYGDPEKLLNEVVTDSMLEDAAARDYYTAYEPALTDDKIEEYTINASVLRAVIETLTSVEKERRGRRGGVSAREIAMEMIEKLRSYPGHTLPTSWVRVSARLREFKAEGYSSVVQRTVGNQKSRKVTEEMGRQIIALKRSVVPQYTNEQIFTEINRIGEIRGWKRIKSINTIVNYLNSPEIMPLWYDAKLGGRAAKQKFGRKHKTNMPLMRDVLWYGDGTKLNLYYKAINEKGRLVMRTTQVYEVMDAYSEVWLGYHISDSENFEAQLAAHRMALDVSGCRPFEIVYDNQSGLKSIKGQALLDRIARMHRPTAPYNASSKSIESAFGRFQKQILIRDWRFTGYNITAKGEFTRPNIELIEANVEKLYTLDELKAAYALARDQWNEEAHHATSRPRIEMYRESVNPDLQPITMADMVDIFWVQHEHSVTFTTWGVTITVDKRKYQYEVYGEDGYPDLEFRSKNTLRKFTVKYDPADMSVVRLYTQDSRGSLKFSAEARPYREIHRAIQEQEEGEMEFIRNMDERMKRAEVERYMSVVELEMEHGVAPEQHGLNRPRIAGMSVAAAEKYLEKSMEHPTTIGATTKIISNMTYDEIERSDKY